MRLKQRPFILIRELATRVHRVLFYFLDPRNWLSMPGELLWYANSLREYKRLGKVNNVEESLKIEPILFGRAPKSGFDSHYVYQAAWAARSIVERKPREHVDVSSQVQFVAQLSAVVPVQLVELRPPELNLAGFESKKGNILSLPFKDNSVDSISCLHVIEHVGLGRYGDSLDPLGTVKSIDELCRVVSKGGYLYLSLPVGRPRVCFNAHRISDPTFIAEQLIRNKMSIVEFSFVNDSKQFIRNLAVGAAKDLDYGCGMYLCQRI